MCCTMPVVQDTASCRCNLVAAEETAKRDWKLFNGDLKDAVFVCRLDLFAEAEMRVSK